MLSWLLQQNRNVDRSLYCGLAGGWLNHSLNRQIYCELKKCTTSKFLTWWHLTYIVMRMGYAWSGQLLLPIPSKYPRFPDTGTSVSIFLRPTFIILWGEDPQLLDFNCLVKDNLIELPFFLMNFARFAYSDVPDGLTVLQFTRANQASESRC